MSFASEIGSDIGPWQGHLQDCITKSPAALDTRLDTLQASVNGRGCYPAYGNEVEFRLSPMRPTDRLPDNEVFYSDLLDAICGDQLPPIFAKAPVLDPHKPAAPLFLNTPWLGSFNFENGGDRHDRIMELRTWPSFDWRESEQRKWNAIAAAGRLAMRYGCWAKITNTQETTSVYWKYRDQWFIENNITNGEALLAMQGARRALYPLEMFGGIRETGPTKAAFWHVEENTVQTRYPGFGLHDTRLNKLGALGGLERMFKGEKPFEEGSVHQCLRLALGGRFDTISGLLAYDLTDQKMVLPRNMSRSMIDACTSGSAGALDWLVSQLTHTPGAHYDDNDAAVLREAVADLSVSPYSSKVDIKLGRYEYQWGKLFRGIEAFLSPAVRLVYKDSPEEEQMPFRRAREAALHSPPVKELLGPELLNSMTPTREVYQLREQRMKVAPKLPTLRSVS